MISIYPFTCLGISSNLVGSVSRRNEALFNPQGVNNVCDPDTQKRMAGFKSRPKGDFDFFYLFIYYFATHNELQAE